MEASRQRLHSCVFCRIIEGKEEAKVLNTTENVIVFRDKWAGGKVHLLAIPKAHIRDVDHLGPADVPLLNEMKEAGMAALENEPIVEDPSKALLVFHCPPYNSVNHLHLHFVIDPLEGRSWKYDVTVGMTWVRTFDAQVALLNAAQIEKDSAILPMDAEAAIEASTPPTSKRLVDELDTFSAYAVAKCMECRPCIDFCFAA